MTITRAKHSTKKRRGELFGDSKNSLQDSILSINRDFRESGSIRVPCLQLSNCKEQRFLLTLTIRSTNGVGRRKTPTESERKTKMRI